MTCLWSVLKSTKCSNMNVTFNGFMEGKKMDVFSLPPEAGHLSAKAPKQWILWIVVKL